MENISRRSWIKWTMGLAASGLAFKQAVAADSCVLTPVQTSGPFYPGEKKFENLNDLTFIPGRPGRALGQVVYVMGKVLDEQCRPVNGVNVEVWQAAASGRYNHERDPNPAALDPNFRYWAETFTNERGEYFFKTIIPGAYPASDDWMRPAHLHFRVAKRGYRELVTQMYFAGDPYNEKDLILLEIPAHLRKEVIVEFLPSSAELEPGSLTGVFDLTIKRIG